MAEQNLKNTAFYKQLTELASEQGEISLLDIVSAMKKHKDAPTDIDAVVEALRSDGIQYSESEDDGPDYYEEPTENDLAEFEEDGDFEDADDIDDSADDDETEPTDSELKDIEDEEDDDDESPSKKDKDDDEDEDEDDDEEEEEENINEWKGTDDDTESSAERFIDISAFSEHSTDHKQH